MTFSPGGTVSVKVTAGAHGLRSGGQSSGGRFSLRTPGQWEGQSGAAGAMGPHPALVHRAGKCPDIPALRGADYRLQLDSESELLPAHAGTEPRAAARGPLCLHLGRAPQCQPAGPELRPDTGSSARE